MNFSPTLRALLLLGGLGAALSSCLSPPDYSTTPLISPESVTVFPLNGTLGPRDSIQIAVKFEDGDGDLGPAVDTDKRTNYFIQPYYKNSSGEFTALIAPGYPVGIYNGTYPQLDAKDSKPAPLKGTLRYALVWPLDNDYFKPGTEYRFDVRIMDRAGNLSNTATTQSAVLVLKR